MLRAQRTDDEDGAAGHRVAGGVDLLLVDHAERVHQRAIGVGDDRVREVARGAGVDLDVADPARVRLGVVDRQRDDLAVALGKLRHPLGLKGES